MKDVVSILEYHNEKLYDVRHIVGKFKEYYGLNLDEMKELFEEYNVCYWEVIRDYLEENNLSNEEISCRSVDYNYYKKVLSILSGKGLRMIELLEYLCSCDKNNKKYEKTFDDLEMYHFTSIMKGKDINRILVLLFHILSKFSDAFENVNCVNRYLKQRINNFAVSFLGDRAYPNEDLLVILDGRNDYNIDDLDKTSFRVNKIKSKVRNKMVN